MDERRRRKTKKEPRKTPQTKIKELKKDIDAFQIEVDNLLKNVPATLADANTCAVCGNPTTDINDMACQHAICRTCADNQMTPFVCPLCEPATFHRFDSSSSSEEI